MDAAAAFYDHSRWIYERDETRSADAVSRAVGLMSVAGALLALAPIGFGIIKDLPERPRVTVAVLLTGSHVCLLVVIGLGLAAVVPKDTSQPRQAAVQERWPAWRNDGEQRIFAAALYEVFAGNLIETDRGTADSPLVRQRQLADRRMRWVSACVWLFSIAMLLAAAAGTVTLWGLQ